MAIRDQYQRLRLLDQLLSRNIEGYTTQALCQLINERLAHTDGVSLRTIQNDLAALKKGIYGNAINIVEERRGRQTVYKYKDPNFSLHALNLDETEQQQILAALALLERSGQYFMPLEQLKRKISPLDTDLPIIEFDDNPDYEGLSWMPKLAQAIGTQTCLAIDYAPYNREPYQILLHPYRLREYNSRWYLCGLAEPHSSPAVQSVLALDRILKVDTTYKVAYKESPFDPEYFEDVIGITVDADAPIEKVRLRFEPNRADYVRTKPLHRTQKGPYPAANGWSEFSIEVRINRELVQTLLAFGGDVEVLEPADLREQITAKLRQALSHYQALELPV